MMRAMRNQGRAPGDTWLQHTYLGYNYRMDELSAALGVVQMGRIQNLLENRSQVAAWYQERLAEISGIEAPALAATTTKVSWFVYVIRLAKGIDRATVAQRLAEVGIPVRPYFLPSTCNRTWSSASASSQVISRSPKTWASAAWLCLSQEK